MTISVGDTLPEATLLRIGDDGPESVELGTKLKGRKVVIFGLPGAFTRTAPRLTSRASSARRAPSTKGAWTRSSACR